MDRAWISTSIVAPTLAELSIYDVPPADRGQARMHANECPEPWPADVMAALAEVVGTFGVVVISLDRPDCMVAARRGSPLLVGIGNQEYIIASDAAAIVSHTSSVIYLDDNEAVEIKPQGLRTVTLDAVPVTKTVEHIAAALEEIELGNYAHRMLKEICEQPDSLRNCLRGRLDSIGHRVLLGGLESVERELARTRRFILTGCGTAWHAALVGEYLMEDLARIHTEVEIASELRYRNPLIDEGTTVIAVSQSGETADTLGALREVHDKGALALGVVNVVGSTIARSTDAGIYLHVGPEISVASTKAFTAQVAVLTMLAMWMGRRRHLSAERYGQLVDALARIPDHVAEVLKQGPRIEELAKTLYQRENWLFLGRGYHLPVALEGALKLRQTDGRARGLLRSPRGDPDRLQPRLRPRRPGHLLALGEPGEHRRGHPRDRVPDDCPDRYRDAGVDVRRGHRKGGGHRIDRYHLAAGRDHHALLGQRDPGAHAARR